MNKIKLAFITGTFALLTTAAVQAAPPETIVIDDCVNKKSAVEFPHAAHFERVECSSCHHTQETLTKESADTAKPCSECHLEPEKKSTPVCSQTSLKKNPFHINCVACHKEEKAGPTKCNDCHPKE